MDIYFYQVLIQTFVLLINLYITIFVFFTKISNFKHYGLYGNKIRALKFFHKIHNYETKYHIEYRSNLKNKKGVLYAFSNIIILLRDKNKIKTSFINKLQTRFKLILAIFILCIISSLFHSVILSLLFCYFITI